MFSSVSSSGVMLDHGLSLDATMPLDCFSGFNASAASTDSPLTDALGTDDLDLLHELLNVDAAADLAAAVPTSPTSPSSSTKRERSPSTSSLEEASDRGTKRARTTGDGKPPKCKSQSQRQKEEIAMLKEQAEQLNSKLSELQERKRQRESSDCATSDESACSSPVKTVARKPLSSQRLWQGMAKRQQAELENVERENSSLRDQVSRRWKQMKNLERSIITAQIDKLRMTNQHCMADDLSEIINYTC